MLVLFGLPGQVVISDIYKKKYWTDWDFGNQYVVVPSCNDGKEGTYPLAAPLSRAGRWILLVLFGLPGQVVISDSYKRSSGQSGILETSML